MTPREIRRRRRGEGFALVVVMWVVIMAALILVGVQKTIRANLAMAHNELESVRAHWIARAGVEQAMAVLASDYTDVDGSWDGWYDNALDFERISLIGGEFSVVAPPGDQDDPRRRRYGLVDHCGRLNLNTADENKLRLACDLEGPQIASILDWRDQNAEARPGGAEGLYYQQLEYPYLIRNGPLQTVDEVRLVRGIDEPAFSGEDFNGNGVLDANEDDLGESMPDDDGDGRLARGLSGLCTVLSYQRNRDADGEERVNVNTADENALKDRFNFTDALARAVVQHRAGNTPNNTPGNRPAGNQPGSPPTRFNRLVELVDVRAAGSPNQAGNADNDKVNQITVTWLANHLDELTLTDEQRLTGAINVNTAPMQVLMTLPQMTAEKAETIVRRRQSGMGPFTSVGQLFTSRVITEAQFKAMAEQVAVRSGVLEIRSTAVTTWGIRHEIVAVVDRYAEPMSVLYWYQSE